MAAPFDGFPRPPADLAQRALPRVPIAAGTTVWRIHPVGRDAIWFGPGAGNPPTHRFDDPKGEYGVCYFGRTAMPAFVESFLRGLPARAVSRAYLATRSLSECVVTRNLRVVQAYGPGLIRLGTTAAVASARGRRGSYAHAQAWSRALHDHPTRPDGVAYHSSHDDALRCVALWDTTAADAMDVTQTYGPVDQLGDLLAGAVRRYRIALL